MSDGERDGARPNRHDEDLRPDGLTVPRPNRFGPDSPGFDDAMVRHRDAMESRSAGYLDPVSGLFVMTAGYLAERGYCCDRGCRHCPYADR